MNDVQVAENVRNALMMRDERVVSAMHDVIARAAKQAGNKVLLADLRNAVDPLHKQRMGPVITAEIAAAIGIALIADGQ